MTIVNSYVEYMGNGIYEMHASATSQGNIIVGEYRIGFRFSQDRNKITYVPMGSYVLSQNAKDIDWITEIVNPPFGDKFFFEPSIIPIGEQKKFEVTDELGILPNIFDEVVIDINLPDTQTGLKGDRFRFDIFATGADLEYAWYVSDYDEETEEWDDPTLINQATQASYETSPSQLSWDKNRYYCIVSNSLGSVQSNTCQIEVIDPNPPEGSNK